MAKGNEYTTKFNIDITDLKRGMQQANQLMKVANSEFKAATGGMDNWGKSADGLSAKLKQLATTLELQKAKLEVLQAEYERVVEVEGENSRGAQDLYIKMNNLKGEIGRTEAQMGKYSTKLEEVRKEQEETANAAEETENAYEKLKKTISKQEEELDQLKKAYSAVALEQGENSEEARSLASQIQRLSAELSDNEAELKDAEKAADKLTSSLSNMDDAAEEAENGFTVMKGALASLIADGIRAAVDGFKELLTASSEAGANFQAQTGASAAEMKKFNKEISELYKNNYGESVQDVADAMAQVKQQAGDIDPSKMKELTKNAIALRDTFGFEINEQMRAVNMLMKQFGLTGEEAFNLIAQGAQNGLDKNGDLLDSINEYSVHYEQLGYTAEEFFNSLTNGTEAGTFSVDKLGDAMKEFGIRVKDTASSTDEGFQLIGLDADLMREKFAQGGESARQATEQVLAALFSMDDQVKQNQAGVSLFGTMWEDLGVEGVQALMNVTGEANSTKATMDELINAKYADVGNQFKEIGRIIQVDFLQPLVSAVLPAVQDFLTTLKNNLPEIINLFSQLTPIIVGIGTAVAVNFAVGKIVAFATAIKAVTTAFIAAKGGIAGVKAAMAALNIVLAANPIGLVIAAIAGLVAVFVTLWNKSDSFRNFWIGLWDSIKSAASTAIDAIISFFTETIPNAFNSLVNFIKENWQSLMKFLINPVGATFEILYNNFEGFRTFVDNFMINVKNIFMNSVNAIKMFFTQTIPQIINNIIMWFQQLPSRIAETFMNVLNAAITWGSNMIAKAIEIGTNFVQNIIQFFNELPYKIGFIIGTVLANIITWGTNMVNKAIEVGTNFVQNIVTFFTQLPGQIYNFITTTYNNIVIWVMNMINKAIELGTMFLNTIIQFFSQLPGRIYSFITTAYNYVVSWVVNMINKAIEAGSRFLQSVISYIMQLPGKILEFLTEIIENLKQWVTDMKEKGEEGAKELFDAVVDGLKELPGKIFDIGADVVRGIWDGISSMAGWLGEKISGFVSGIVDGFKSAFDIGSPSKVMRDKIGKWLPAGIAEGIDKNAKVAAKSMKNMVKQLVPKADELKTQLSASVTGIKGNLMGRAKPQNANVTNNYNFNQTNNSPKNLSRREIYRQTKNLLDLVEVS